MRLWNLVTGKKAGVLTFEKGTAGLVGIGRWRGGEGMGVEWSADGEEFVVIFERGAVVYGLDCRVRGVVRVERGKVCHGRYVLGVETASVLLALSTDDGRVMFFNTKIDGTFDGQDDENPDLKKDKVVKIFEAAGQITSDTHSRIKDFQVLRIPDSDHVAVVTVTSGGTIDIWEIAMETFLSKSHANTTSSVTGLADGTVEGNAADKHASNGLESHPQGAHWEGVRLIGTYQSGRRLTCVAAFVMEAAQKKEVIDQ